MDPMDLSRLGILVVPLDLLDPLDLSDPSLPSRSGSVQVDPTDPCCQLDLLTLCA